MGNAISDEISAVCRPAECHRFTQGCMCPRDQTMNSVEVVLDPGVSTKSGTTVMALTKAFKPSYADDPGRFEGDAAYGECVRINGQDHVFPNGATYTGEWLGHARHGQGIHVELDGSVYHGQWVDDKAHGCGILQHVDGDKYDGEWSNNNKHGRGTYIHRDGAKYVGEWLNDMQWGHGNEAWGDGVEYSGQYVNGRKHGRGKYSWANMSYYEGNFINNDISGDGIYVWSDGCRYTGQWICQKMEGKGRFMYPDGTSYEGEYQSDRKHGHGIFSWPDGRRYEGQWREGRQHGIGTWTANGQVRSGTWQDGKRMSWADEDQAARASGAGRWDDDVPNARASSSSSPVRTSAAPDTEKDATRQEFALAVGTRVVIQSCEEERFTGEAGVIEDWDAPEKKWSIRLESGHLVSVKSGGLRIDGRR